jgi:arsenate reductase (thioredoxin)
MREPRTSVLFVCTGNSARSQMAEAILRREGGDRFDVSSAGTSPRGVHPLTIRVLEGLEVPTETLRSKSVDEFLGRSFDYVITVCDRARDACPSFPGGGRTLHWGFDDPAEATGTEAEQLAVFERVLGEISMRIRSFVPVAERARQAAGG